MSLNSLISYISNSQIITELVKRIKHNNELNIIGSSRYAKSIIINSIAKKENKDILIISPNEEIAYKWYGYFDSIDNKNVLYLIDFGLSRLPQDGSEMRTICGSPLYVAPEILDMNLSDTAYTPAVDMWATGCVLAELISDIPIFPGTFSMNMIKTLAHH